MRSGKRAQRISTVRASLNVVSPQMMNRPDADGVVVVFFSGEQFGVETAAKLIQRCAPSALPFSFEWASDCDRLRAGEFGGGYVAITADTIEYGHTSLSCIPRASTSRMSRTVAFCDC